MDPQEKHRGLAGLSNLVAPCWEYITRDELTAWCWKKIRVFTWVAVVITVILTLFEYVQTLFLNQLLMQGMYGPVFLAACIMCMGLIYYAVYFIGLLFFYPLRMYRRSYLQNGDLQFAPLRFRDRYAMIFAPMVLAYILISAPSLLGMLLPSMYIAHFFMPWVLDELPYARISFLDYTSTLIIGVFATCLTFVTFLTVAQETIRYPHIPKGRHLHFVFTVIPPLLPWILHSLVASGFTLAQTYEIFPGISQPLLYLLFYTVFAFIVLRWAASYYFASIERIRRDCFQPVE